MQESEPREPGELVCSRTSLALTVTVRILGLLLLVCGLWALVTVLFEAVGLYRDPGRIEAMVVTIERAAGLPTMDISRNAGPSQLGADGPSPPATLAFRPAYFLGWFLAILLFLVIGKLADWLLSRGLALVSFRCGRGGAGQA
ncbi:MAG: hypothetical protein U5S82_03445 [Gammaproteobacteria bacterium]|nr:hypothetical protein [Gammaproteobacteria bacterium]